MNVPHGRSAPATQLSPAGRSYNAERAGPGLGVICLMKASASRIVANMGSVPGQTAGIITTL